MIAICLYSYIHQYSYKNTKINFTRRVHIAIRIWRIWTPWKDSFMVNGIGLSTDSCITSPSICATGFTCINICSLYYIILSPTSNSCKNFLNVIPHACISSLIFTLWKFSFVPMDTQGLIAWFHNIFWRYSSNCYNESLTAEHFHKLLKMLPGWFSQEFTLNVFF